MINKGITIHLDEEAIKFGFGIALYNLIEKRFHLKQGIIDEVENYFNNMSKKDKEKLFKEIIVNQLNRANLFKINDQLRGK